MNISCKYTDVGSIINQDTTRDQFLNKLKEYPNLIGSVKKYDSDLITKAAIFGNIDLIDCIIEITGKFLLSQINSSGLQPLHSVISTAAAGENAYLGARKLIQRGASINSIGSASFGRGSALFMALNNQEANKISTLLLRLNAEESGQIWTLPEKLKREPIMEANLNAAKIEMMNDEEQLFKLLKLASQESISTFNVLPQEVINNILKISAKLI